MQFSVTGNNITIYSKYVLITESTGLKYAGVELYIMAQCWHKNKVLLCSVSLSIYIYVGVS